MIRVRGCFEACFRWAVIESGILHQVEVSDVPRKATSPKVARKASKLLNDSRTGKTAESVAASALSQREKRRR